MRLSHASLSSSVFRSADKSPFQMLFSCVSYLRISLFVFTLLFLLYASPCTWSLRHQSCYMSYSLVPVSSARATMSLLQVTPGSHCSAWCPLVGILTDILS